VYFDHLTDSQHRHAARSSIAEDLSRQLRAHLRLVAEFATLGAYELTDSESDARAAGATPRSAERSGSSVCTSGERRASRRHVAAASIPCPVPADGRRAPASCDRGGRRSGGVQTPVQPCICAGDSA
jgi:hypothetical protein